MSPTRWLILVENVFLHRKTEGKEGTTGQTKRNEMKNVNVEKKIGKGWKMR